MIKYKNYDQNQDLLLPPDLNAMIGEKELVRIVNQVIDQIDSSIYKDVFKGGGCPSYNPRMMLKVIIYGYCCKVYSCRKIALSLKRDICFMWLSGMQYPNFNTVNRFRSIYFKDILVNVFAEVVMFLIENSYITTEDYFVDGSKFEANAGKYSHVWRKNTERFSQKVKERANTIIKEADAINESEELFYDTRDLPETGAGNNLTAESIKKSAKAIADKVTSEMTKSQQRKILSKSKSLLKEADKLEKYDNQKAILNGRNSYSKTDEDATFMRLKDDLLRAAYNVQAGTQNSFVTGFSISQNANDATAFIDHMKKRKELKLPEVKTVTADAVYGTEENYSYMDKNLPQTRCYLKYPTFYKEMKGKLPAFHKDNFAYITDEDHYICPGGRKLKFHEIKNTTTASGYKYSTRIYKCVSCDGCKFSEKCKKAKGSRKVERNIKLEQYKKSVKENLCSDKGIKLRKRRAPEVETVYGDIKQNMGIKRLFLRGVEKVEAEFSLIFTAYNIRKMALAL